MQALNLTQPGKQRVDFFDYWDSLGFFDNIKLLLPPNFMALFEIARIIFSEETSEAFNAIEEITAKETVYVPERDENIQVNRKDRIAPVGNKMELTNYRTIHDLKKALPRELAHDDDMLNVKLLTKSLIIREFYESEADTFKPISTSRDESGKDANRFEQKFFILLDRSKSMEAKMRTFYAKCIVAEFLRRKLNTRAKLFYRPFDSKTGALFRVEKREDFPLLIEEVLLTTTEGKGTNIHDAILTAISDIKFDKEMLKTEILVVTDGISSVNKNELKVKLGDIKLHVLKIGDELAEPNFFDLESQLSKERSGFDFQNVNMKEVHDKFVDSKAGKKTAKLTLNEQRAIRIIQDTSDAMTMDLRELSSKFIEIKDLPAGNLYEVKPETLEYIKSSLDRFYRLELETIDIEDKKKLYKQVNFLSQYIQMLMDNGNEDNQGLKAAQQRILTLKEKWLKDADLIMSFKELEKLEDDKNLQKMAKKEAKKLMKEMEKKDRSLSIKEMKQAQMIFSGDSGKGSSGQFLLLMLIKLFQLLKWLFLLPVRLITGKKKEEEKK